jgi:hypothetical protein
VRRLALALLVPALALAGVVDARGQAQAIEPTFQLDAKKDVRGPLDVVRVAMSRRLDGSLRAELTLRRAWTTADVGAGGSLCVKLYVKTDPEAQVPEYLVCATPPADGDELAGRVLRNRANGLPRTIGTATLARAGKKTLHLTFAPDLIRTPARLRFAGESVWRGEGCPKVLGCRDIAPDPPDARDFRLRPGADSG